MWIVKEIANWAKESFNNEVFTARIASSFNLVLTKIVGPHCIELKVQNPKKYKFNPLKLLVDLVHIYTDLSTIEMFNKTVAGDTNFDLKYMHKAYRVMKKNRMYEEYNRLSGFIQKISELADNEEYNEDEKIFEEAPDDFLCPIAYCFMKDPVRLPTSGNTVDRSTIKRILLNDEHDPFNRAPLKYSQVEDDIEMRERIQKWIQQKKNGVVTDEDKKEQLEITKMEVHKEEDSHMSVDQDFKKVDKSLTVENPEESINYEEMTEEQQIKMAMEMSLQDWVYKNFK
jgi:ubiquitin conjugation factor E4 B